MTTKEVKDKAEKTLSVEILEALLRPLKQMKDSWKKTDEIGQRALMNQLHLDIGTAVRRAVNIIAADKRPTMEAQVEQVVFKDGIKCVLQLSKTMADRHELADAQGQAVLIVITNTEKLTGGKVPEADKNQPSLPGVKTDDKKEVKRDPRTKRGGTPPKPDAKR